MSKKIILLIIASIIGLSALSLIQAYLIKNTYSLKKEVFVDKTMKAVDDIDDHATPIDSIYDILSDKFIKELDNYSLKIIDKEYLLERLHVITDSLNPAFIKEYEKSIKEKKLGYNLKYHKILKSIIVSDSVHKDTVFKQIKEKEYKLIGYDFKSDPMLRVGNSTSETERSFKKVIRNKEKRVSYRLYFQSENYINIDDWNSIIFNQMRGLLLCSFFIFLLVIGILYYSIKNLISQKKIADVKTDFVNNITHELKTPLATLSLATKILKNQTIQESKSVNSTIETIERQQLKLQKLIDQVLNNSLGYKDILLQKEEVVISNYLHTVLDDFKVTCSDEISLKRQILDTKTRINLDTFYCTTVLVNILDNAIKYGGTNIVVSSKLHQNNVTISIQDNGIGIPKKHQKIIFEKFFRSENKNIHNVKGLGLGLYYSNQIIKAHQGVLSVVSEKDTGTIFTVKLPFN